jgi:hypothetical protein
VTLTPTTYLTLLEIARDLRYDGPRAEANCREWLRRRGIRPSLKRGLFRRDLIEAALDREERGFKPSPSRSEQSQGSRQSVSIPSQSRADLHAAQSDSAAHPNPVTTCDLAEAR